MEADSLLDNRDSTWEPPFALFEKSRDMTALNALFRSRTFWVCTLACVLVGIGAAELLAQAPAPAAPPAGGSTTVTLGRSLTFEWIITVAMCGLALFVVCRSSNRN